MMPPGDSLSAANRWPLDDDFTEPAALLAHLERLMMAGGIDNAGVLVVTKRGTRTVFARDFADQERPNPDALARLRQLVRIEDGEPLAILTHAETETSLTVSVRPLPRHDVERRETLLIEWATATYGRGFTSCSIETAPPDVGGGLVLHLEGRVIPLDGADRTA